MNGREPLVVRNDEASWEELERLEFDNVVISRGRDAGAGARLRRLRRSDPPLRAPLLGVCLGSRGSAGWRGEGRARRRSRCTAASSRSSTTAHPLFAGIPSPFQATRYHSLALAHPLPASLRETATCDGVPMAIEHRDRPQWGVQFHPESIATEHGSAAPNQLPRPHASTPVPGHVDLAQRMADRS